MSFLTSTDDTPHQLSSRLAAKVRMAHAGETTLWAAVQDLGSTASSPKTQFWASTVLGDKGAYGSSIEEALANLATIVEAALAQESTEGLSILPPAAATSTTPKFFRQFTVFPPKGHGGKSLI